MGAVVLLGASLIELVPPPSLDHPGPFLMNLVLMNLAAVLVAAAYGGLPAGLGAPWHRR